MRELGAWWCQALTVSVMLALGAPGCSDDEHSGPADRDAIGDAASDLTDGGPDDFAGDLSSDASDDPAEPFDAADGQTDDSCVDQDPCGDPAEEALADPGVTDNGADSSDQAQDPGIDSRPLTPTSVRIIRDTWGVPHVLGGSERATGYGLGWAQADDRLVSILTSLWTALGRRTEIDGPALLPADRTMRLLRLVEDVEDAWDGYPLEIKDYLEGFAQGFNAYMEAHPDEVPAWAEPIQASWTIGLARLFLMVAQVDRANRERGGLGPGLVSLAFFGGEFDKLGSNGWAVAPERTPDGVAFMTGDPHMPYYYEWRTYESHVRTPSFEVAGAGFAGVPVPFFGHTRWVAWTWTWNLPDHADTYRLTLDPENSEHYLLDGESVPFVTEQAQFKLPNGEVLTETLRWSVHGPVVHVNAEAGYALAYWLSGFGQGNTPVQYLDMVRAHDLDEFNQAMGQLQYFTFNSVAADVEGSIQYVWNARIPRRTAGVNHDRPLDGTTSDTLWNDVDPIPFDELPSVRDPDVGYVQNCNNSWWMTTRTEADPGPEAMPNGLTHDEVDTERAWRVRQALGDGNEVSEAQAMALATEGRLIPAAAMLPLIAESWEQWGESHTRAEDIEEVVDLLGEWDGSPELWSAAPTIFTLWAYEMFDQIEFPTYALEWTVGDLTEELGTSILDAIASAVDTAAGMAPSWRIPWGFIHVLQLGETKIPVATGQYPAISLMNCNLDPTSTDALYCQIGSAYTFFNVMEEPIRTYSVMPFSNSDDPDSPYYAEMSYLFAERTLKPLPFTDEELAEHWASELLLTLPDTSE